MTPRYLDSYDIVLPNGSVMSRSFGIFQVQYTYSRKMDMIQLQIMLRMNFILYYFAIRSNVTLVLLFICYLVLLDQSCSWLVLIR